MSTLFNKLVNEKPNYEVGDKIKVISGVLKGASGKISGDSPSDGYVIVKIKGKEYTVNIDNVTKPGNKYDYNYEKTLK